jgi:hypothetical protein
MLACPQIITPDSSLMLPYIPKTLRMLRKIEEKKGCHPSSGPLENSCRRSSQRQMNK